VTKFSVTVLTLTMASNCNPGRVLSEGGIEDASGSLSVSSSPTRPNLPFGAATRATGPEGTYLHHEAAGLAQSVSR
jgi:hypothetical protein